MKKTLRYIFLTLIIPLLAISIMVYSLQNNLIFFPAPLEENAPHLVHFQENEIFLKHSDVELHGWVLNPGGEKIIFYYGGNAEEVSYNLKDFNRFNDFTIVLINYRGYGKSEGTPSQESLYSDALFVYDYFNNKSEYKNAEYIVMGRSLGSAVATYVAGKRRINKQILITPFDSIKEVAKHYYPFLPISLLLRHPFDSVQNLQGKKIPTLILVAEKDEVIPYGNTKTLIKNLADSALEIKIENAGHNSIQSFPDYWESIKEFLGK